MNPAVTSMRGLSIGTNGSAGSANHVLQVPAHAQLLGMGMSVQSVTAWFDPTIQQVRLTTSPALDVTLAGRLPALNAATVTSVLMTPADAWPPTGRVNITRVPVTYFGW